MAPAVQLFARDDSQNAITPTIVAGIVVAALLGVGCAIWLAVHAYRRRHRHDEPGTSFVTVRGLVRDGEREKVALPDIEVQGVTFSRGQLTAGIVMPEKAVIRPNASREEIIQHHSADGSLPRPFAPFAAGSVGGGGSRRSSYRLSSASFLSINAPSFRNSVISTRSHRSSVASFSSTGSTQQRKVRQIFNPALPDEVVISLGESLIVLQSFDDGWCIVGRDGKLSKGDVELGAVPAWVFIKPTKGLRAERPIRTSSLGVTVTMQAPGAREDIISWSNFS